MSTGDTVLFRYDYQESDLDVDNAVFLADIAESSAMIADKLCGAESEDK